MISQLTGREPPIPFLYKMFKDSIFDMRMITYLLSEILTSDHQLHAYYTKRVLHNILKSFEQAFDYVLDGEHSQDPLDTSLTKKRSIELN